MNFIELNHRDFMR